MLEILKKKISCQSWIAKFYNEIQILSDICALTSSYPPPYLHQIFMYSIKVI